MPKKQSNSNLLEVQNAAKTMFANIRFQSIDKDLRTIMLTSSVPDEGKTTSVWYLAQAAATAGHTVLVVEADMRRRSLANTLKLHPKNGLFSVLMGTAQLSDAVVPTSVRKLYFLDAEPSIPNPADLLASKRMRMLNEHLAEQFDYVIYDTPPVGTFVDAAVLGSIVDASIMVVRPGRVKRSELLAAYSQLTSGDANVIGICTTFVEGTGADYYYYYYTKGEKKRRRHSEPTNVVQAALDDDSFAMGSPSTGGAPVSTPIPGSGVAPARASHVSTGSSVGSGGPSSGAKSPSAGGPGNGAGSAASGPARKQAGSSGIANIPTPSVNRRNQAASGGKMGTHNRADSGKK